MLLSIIILNYNTQELTLQTLRSVFQELEHSALLKDHTEVFVVDNHSSDGSQVALQKLAKERKISLILNQENLGFPKGNNAAIKQAKGKYILLLNSDTIVEDRALELLVKTFEAQAKTQKTATLASHEGELDHLGILAAELVNRDGSVQRQGGAFPTMMSLMTHMLFLDDLPMIGRLLPSTQYTGRSAAEGQHAQGLVQQDWVGGAAMMVRSEVFAEVGLLDENIFMYAEDVELCMRARGHHWDVAVEPRARITHLGSASSSSANAIIGELKGYLYIWSKHKPHWQYPLVKRLIQLGIVLRIILFGTMIRQPERAAVYRKAWLALKLG